MEKKNLSAEMAAASAEAARVVNGVPEGTLDAPTPCGDWDLRTLLNHTILWTSYSAERRAHGESVAEELMNKDFTADPGFREDYARQIGKAVSAWADPEGLGRHAQTSWATPPRPPTWARCCSWRRPCTAGTWPGPPARSSATDEQTATALEDIVQAQAELFRKYQGFADAVEPPKNATAFERALTLSGRDPDWKRRRHNDAVSTRTGEP